MNQENETVAVIIPARLGATRLPNKPLADLHGKPMIWHVWNRARRAQNIAGVWIATPDAEIVRAVEGFGGTAILTSPLHRTGGDRVAEAALSLPPHIRIVINVQGDEPLLDPQTIDAACAPLIADENLLMASAMCRLPEGRETDAAVVKVVCDLHNFALYFSRAALPFVRGNAAVACKQHVGLYAYRRDFLQTLASLPPSPLEQAESLEQLRVLENGYRIRMVEIAGVPESVDTPEDLERVRGLLADT